MASADKVYQKLFHQTDSILMCDANGKVLYYQDYDDQINMIRGERAIGRSIFELYPFFKRDEFTTFRSIDKKQPILNEIQIFEVNGVTQKALNSSYPLIDGSKVVGCITLSVALNGSVPRKRTMAQAKYGFADIITQDRALRESFEKLKMIAQGSSSLLIYGETGTGKELIAHAVHSHSPRHDRPFLTQNCAAIPDNLMESTLFGATKGSFTGAVDRPGLFEVADGGTLYLDEINSLSLELQGKLLRAVENDCICRIGETTERAVDVRIIASTNEDLLALVKRGRFRKDLFYRLNVTNYAIPPLRERAGDIPLLTDHYIRIFNQRFDHSVSGLGEDALCYFMSYPWEGNVRELKNVLEYACSIKRQGEITVRDLPGYMFAEQEPDPLASAERETLNTGAPAGPQAEPYVPLEEQLDRLERQIIQKAVMRNRYNMTKTAAELKIARQTLYAKLKKYSIL